MSRARSPRAATASSAPPFSATVPSPTGFSTVQSDVFNDVPLKSSDTGAAPDADAAAIPTRP